MKQKTALVLGAGGFIGNHLVNRLKSEGFWVRGVDLKYPEYQDKSNADEFVIGDLRNTLIVSKVMFAPEQSTLDKNGFDEV
jgi:nucleoside-diphosphate-sugar epimerase